MTGMSSDSPDNSWPPPINEPLLLLKAMIFAAVFIGLGKLLLGGFPATIGEAIFVWVIATYGFFFRSRQRALREFRRLKKWNESRTFI
jgi:hypothetical protein